MRHAALALLAACGSRAPDVGDYVAALKDGHCERVRETTLRDDCLSALAEHDGIDHCREASEGRATDECFFQLAESSQDVKWCGQAGGFADDCRLHHLSRQFRGMATTRVGADDTEDDVARAIRAAGLADDDPRPWSAWYREILGRQRPLDRSRCTTVADASHREACLQTGLALYNDRLNRARDTRTFPCAGGSLPPELETSPDPQIEALRASRTDLCPG